VDARTRLLGKEPPDTVSAVWNLARTYYQLGRYADAEKLYICVVDARTRLLKEEHPDTISAMADLAWLYKKLGGHADAKKLQVHVVNARTRLLGEHHPKTILTMSNSAVEHKRPQKISADAEDAQNNMSNKGDRILAEEHQIPTKSEVQQKKKGS
jgi:hypothetical protein